MTAESSGGNTERSIQVWAGRTAMWEAAASIAPPTSVTHLVKQEHKNGCAQPRAIAKITEGVSSSKRVRCSDGSGSVTERWGGVERGVGATR